MAHILTETAAKGSSVSVPDDGDLRDAASVAPAFQALSNRVKYQEANARRLIVSGVSAAVTGTETSLTADEIKSINLGTLAVGDIVKIHAEAGLLCASVGWKIRWNASQNGGGYTAVFDPYTTFGFAPDATPGNLPIVWPIALYTTVTTAGAFIAQLVAQRGASNLQYATSDFIYEVWRV